MEGSDWVEHTTQDGRRYYYNRHTRKSSWHKPQELMSPIERADLGTNWRESTTSNGRKYYYNRETKQSVWTMPQELHEARERARQEMQQHKQADQTTQEHKQPDHMQQHEATDPQINAEDQSASTDEQRQAKPVELPEEKEEQPEPYPAVDKEEGKRIFKQLLDNKCVSPDAEWEDAMRMIISDKRYGVLRALGERRACFHEWRDQKAKEDREEQRKRKEEARQQLKSLLQASKSVTGSTRYKDVERLFGSKKAWDDLQTVADRHSVIDEVVAERAQEEREQERAEQRKAMQAYKALLDSCDWIVPGTKWRKVDAALEQHSESQALRKEQRLQAFADFAREVEQRAEEKKEAEREERRDKERQNRQDFVQMLEQKKADGQITMKTRWRSFEPKLKEEDSYQAVTSNQEGSRPRELFEDLLEQLSSEVEEYRQSVEVTVNQMMTLPDEYERFAEQVRTQHDIPEPHLRSLWEDSYAPEAETHADNEDDNDKKPRGKKRKHHQKHESAAIPDGEDGEETKRQRREQHTGAFDEEDEEGEIRD